MQMWFTSNYRLEVELQNLNNAVFTYSVKVDPIIWEYRSFGMTVFTRKKNKMGHLR